MNILLVTVTYPPEIRAISAMMRELAIDLRARGHAVTVVTAWPNYNLADDIKEESFAELAIENDIKVIRVKNLPFYRKNYIVRGIAQLFMPYLFLRKVKKHVRTKIDTVIVYSPPLPLALVGIRLKKISGTRFLLNIQDIFPQNAVDLGIIRNRLIIRFFENMEHRAYVSADAITTHTQTSRTFLIERKGAPSEKISVVHNWIDLKPYETHKPKGKYRNLYHLEDKFIFLFSGIIGPSQGLDFILEVADKLRDITQICFLIVGDGSEKKRLQAASEEMGLDNVVFQPYVSTHDYPLLVKDVDVGLICLSIKNKTPVIPGKIIGFMAGAIPVVAFLNKESDGHKLIRDAQAGYSLLSEDSGKAAQLIRKIYNEKEKIAKFGYNGYNYVKKYFSKEICINAIESLLK